MLLHCSDVSRCVLIHGRHPSSAGGRMTEGLGIKFDRLVFNVLASPRHPGILELVKESSCVPSEWLQRETKLKGGFIFRCE